jgi:hypothetical protein
MDSARLANVEALAARLHAAGGPCFLVAANGTAPGVAGIDVDMREGLGRSITVADAIKWAKTPGFHWLKGECYSPAECASKLSSLRGVAVFARNRIIISCGPDRDWPPVGR